MPIPKLWKNKRVYILSLLDKNPNAFDLTAAANNFCRVIEIVVDSGIVAAGVIICDFEGWALGHVPKLNLVVMKKVYMILEVSTRNL